MPSRKGIPNKLGSTAKENIAAVFTRLGGTAEMAEWARQNQTEFYKLYARLIPVEHSGSIELKDARELTDAALAAIASSRSEGIAEASGDSLESDGLVH